MEVFHKDIYKELPDDILEGDNKEANKHVFNILKSALPKGDSKLENFHKTLYSLPLNQTDKPTHRRAKKNSLSRKEKMKLNLLQFPKKGWNYNDFELLRQMWIRYITRYLNNLKNNTSEICNILYKVDYHGAQMKVYRSKCPSLVGISGTCILDTKNAFKILSKDNKCRTIIKNNSAFELEVNNLTLRIQGKHINSRPAERSSKKRKSVIDYDL